MILGRERLVELINEGKSNPGDKKHHITITNSCSEAKVFSLDNQVGRDSIDLRISNRGYKLKCNYNFINTLDKNITEYFEDIELSIENGYDVLPGTTIIVGTVERVKLAGPFFGQVTGRTRYARMGLSVHCTATKFQGYSNAIIALQITNHNKVPLKIFPFQSLAQLIIHQIDGYPDDKVGDYYDEEYLLKPMIDDKELDMFNESTIPYIKRHKPKIDTSKTVSGDQLQAIKIQKRLAYLIITITGLVSIFGFFSAIWPTITNLFTIFAISCSALNLLLMLIKGE